MADDGAMNARGGVRWALIVTSMTAAGCAPALSPPFQPLLSAESLKLNKVAVLFVAPPDAVEVLDSDSPGQDVARFGGLVPMLIGQGIDDELQASRTASLRARTGDLTGPLANTLNSTLLARTASVWPNVASEGTLPPKLEEAFTFDYAAISPQADAILHVWFLTGPDYTFAPSDPGEAKTAFAHRRGLYMPQISVAARLVRTSDQKELFARVYWYGPQTQMRKVERLYVADEAFFLDDEDLVARADDAKNALMHAVEAIGEQIARDLSGAQ
jgi:hypothetical protein